MCSDGPQFLQPQGHGLFFISQLQPSSRSECQQEAQTLPLFLKQRLHEAVLLPDVWRWPRGNSQQQRKTWKWGCSHFIFVPPNFVLENTANLQKGCKNSIMDKNIPLTTSTVILPYFALIFSVIVYIYICVYIYTYVYITHTCVHYNIFNRALWESTADPSHLNTSACAA